MILAAIAFYPAAAFAQADAAFQVRHFSNLTIGDSVINLTNTGASSTNAYPTQNGNLCVNVYTFSPDEQLISCCACTVTPNGLVSLSARNDLTSNPLTLGVPTSIIVKLLATAGTGNGAGCSASTAGAAADALFPPAPGGNPIVSGLAAWGTTIHAVSIPPGKPPTVYALTETAFTPATLSRTELSRITTLCGFIQVDGSGFGICRSCRTGGLGGPPSAL
ncbi:MAG: hypothetical protein ACR2I2_08605 [Bryobacteraceae bacterium]